MRWICYSGWWLVPSGSNSASGPLQNQATPRQNRGKAGAFAYDDAIMLKCVSLKRGVGLFRGEMIPTKLERK
jgi:hypothetical protein